MNAQSINAFDTTIENFRINGCGVIDDGTTDSALERLSMAHAIIALISSQQSEALSFEDARLVTNDEIQNGVLRAAEHLLSLGIRDFEIADLENRKAFKKLGARIAA